ncbi:hypothetical protein AY601_2973 [Pedobacter cryoconitis]|uniref:Knr4/Smi1-like domain-containing protein n=1 Tax=Pedobacter cryoconitis TaxID=188932 RepID=A0A127VF33_9SPHI|nr:SMI1/KNR4 family protein [Pedobacter cryoconitis]AMP99847.1 hypothetical protein AY601_2973 [Pedobacter cryoconitis]
MIEIHQKIKSLGDIIFRKKREERHNTHHTLEFIKSVMDALPEQRVIDFIKEYGFSTFKNYVMIKSFEKSSFLSSGEIKLGLIFGFGDGTDSVKDAIDTYFIEEQLNWKFFPLFEGYPGDIIFYSLEPETRGKIYYWHHEGDINADKSLIANSFEEFINNLYLKQKEEEEEEPELSADELASVNERRKRVGLPLIVKNRNEIT